MPRKLADQPWRQPRVASPEFTRLLFVAFGIAGLIGLLSGIGWVIWHLVVR